jgi:hypothetical protein
MDYLFVLHPKRLIKDPESLRDENERKLGLRYQEVLPESVGERWADARVSTIVSRRIYTPFILY